jgi:hypothetical protein
MSHFILFFLLPKGEKFQNQFIRTKFFIHQPFLNKEESYTKAKQPNQS